MSNRDTSGSMSTGGERANGSGVVPAGTAPSDLGFYFAGPQDMLRKLETSKPVRRTRVEGSAKKGEEDAGKQGAGGAGGGAADQQQYLFKWQRDAEDEVDEDALSPEQAPPAGGSAKWAKITGNVVAALLSIGPYFEVDGPKGKPIRDSEEGVLVNAGGVVLLQPDFSKQGGGTGGAVRAPGVIIDESSKTGEAFNSDDLLLRAGTLEDPTRHVLERSEPRERLWFQHPGVQWPPEAPAFPPPPPNLSETVAYKKVSRGPQTLVKRLSRVRPDLAAQRDVPTSRDVARDALVNTPQYAAAMAGSAARGLADAVGMGMSGRNLDLSGQAGDRAAGSISRQRAPSTQPQSAASKRTTTAATPSPGGGILRRLSFMPGVRSAESAQSFQGVYAVLVPVPYVLPPPPEPRKPPPAGSSEERRLQRINIKMLFLEDCYSQLVELALERISTKEYMRELEGQITDMDLQLSALLGAGEE